MSRQSSVLPPLDTDRRKQLEWREFNAKTTREMIDIADWWHDYGYEQTAKRAVDRTGTLARDGLDWIHVALAYLKLGYRSSYEAAMANARNANR